MSLNIPKNAFIRERTIENQKAGQNPETEKPGTNFEAKRINRAFITREKSPRVSIVMGRAIIFITGFIKIFIIPKTTDNTMAPVNVTKIPGTK